MIHTGGTEPHIDARVVLWRWKNCTKIVLQRATGNFNNIRHRPFRWPHGRIEAIWSTSPNAASPGLHWKPLDAAIRQLLTPYGPGCRQGDNQQNNDAKCTQFFGHFDGHRNATVRYCALCLMVEVRGFRKSHLTPPLGEHLQTSQRLLFLLFYCEKGLEFELTCWPLITIGVWHIKLTIRT